MGSSEFSFTQDGGSMATILYIVLATVVTTAYSEATGDAQQYGYTPAPTPYGVEPVYQETPVYHATPVVAHATPVVAHATHHVSTVHHVVHAAPYHEPAPYHPAPAPYHAPKHDDYKP